MKFIVVLLVLFVQNAFATDVNKAIRKIEEKYGCTIETLDGYMVKDDISKILQFKLTNSEFIDKSVLSEAIASDCAILIFDNVLGSISGFGC